MLREVECFAAVTHPHVLPFLGACLSDSDRCLLITELMPGGNLKEWLYGPPNTRKPHRRLSDRLCMALHVRLPPADTRLTTSSVPSSLSAPFLHHSVSRRVVRFSSVQSFL